MPSPTEEDDWGPLIDLAEAAGMSISGVRIGYDNEELGQLVELLGRGPVPSPAADARGQGKSEHRGTATLPVLREDLSPDPGRSAAHGPAGLPRRQIRLRVYQCPAGQGWHLTSRRPPRKRRAARERARRYAQIRARRTQRPAPPETLAAGKRGETNTLP
jgi:hypothetical protein